MKINKLEFDVVIERDDEGYYIGSVPVLPGCHTQAKDLDELMGRMKEAIELYLEINPGAKKRPATHFAGVQRVMVSA